MTSEPKTLLVYRSRPRARPNRAMELAKRGRRLS
jgi:hypothetical protein